MAKPFKARWQIRSLLEQHGLVHSTTLLVLLTGNGRGGCSDMGALTAHRSHSFVGGVRTAGVGVGPPPFTCIGHPLRLISAGKAGAYAQLASALVVCIAAVWFAWFTGAGSPVMRAACWFACLRCV